MRFLLLRLSPSIVAGTLAAGLTLFSAGCTQTDFPPEKAQGLVALAPIHLDAEQVSLTYDQVECGVREDLWDPPMDMGEHKLAHLTAVGRALNFDDDVVVMEPGFNRPYVQVRGDFSAVLADGPVIHDDGQYGKKVEGKLAIAVRHQCFNDPLPVMGVRHGKFNQDVLPTLQYTLDSKGWHFDKVIH